MTTSFTELSLNDAREKYPLYPIAKPEFANISLQPNHATDSGKRPIIAPDMVDQTVVFTVEKTGNSIHRIYGSQFEKDANKEMVLFFLDITVLNDCAYDLYIIGGNEASNQIVITIKEALNKIYANIIAERVVIKEFINTDKNYKYTTAILTKQDVVICKHDEKYAQPGDFLLGLFL